ncbi:hypothetical protein ACFE04_001474 [Oxalis oulophora]
MTGLGSSCGACKFLRRKCTSECVFAPYFCYDQAANHFASVHKIFGASNVAKLLSNLPLQSRSHAAITISYQALARVRDPIYGCVSHIFALQQQVANLQGQIELLGNQINNSAFGVFSGEIYQSITNPCIDFQVFPQDNTNILRYQNEQQPEFVNHAVNTTGNLAMNSPRYEMLSPLHGDGNSISDSYLTPLERFLEGVDQEIMAHSLWMDNGNHVTN